MCSQRHDLSDDPLMSVMETLRRSQTATWRYIDEIMKQNRNYVTDSLEETKQYVRQNSNARSKLATYLDMNTELVSPGLYKIDVPEYMRVAVSRLRLISHNLKIETGRWSRIDRDRRLCQCGKVQTERHIVQECHLLKNVRDKFSQVDINDYQILMNCNNLDTAKLLFELIANV